MTNNEEKTILRIDPSSLKECDCARRFELENMRGYAEKTPSHKTEYGSALHLAAANYFRGKSALECTNSALEYFMNSPCDPGDDYRNLGHLEQTTRQYLDTYDRKYETFRPLRVDNNTMAVELPFKIPFMSFPTVDVILCGVMDAIGYDRETLCIKDIKTTSLNQRYYFEGFETNIQMLIYSYALRASGLTDRYVPVMIDGVFLSKKDATFERRLIDIHETRVEECMDWVRERVTDIVAKIEGGRSFTKNYSRCDTKYGTCKFHNVCKSSPTLAQNILDAHFMVRTYDPSTFGQVQPST